MTKLPPIVCFHCRNLTEDGSCKLVQEGKISKKEERIFIYFHCPYFAPDQEWQHKWGNKTQKEVAKILGYEWIINEMIEEIKEEE